MHCSWYDMNVGKIRGKTAKEISTTAAVHTATLRMAVEIGLRKKKENGINNAKKSPSVAKFGTCYISSWNISQQSAVAVGKVHAAC